MKKIFILAAFFMAFTPSTAFSKTTGWMNKSEFAKFAKTLRRSNENPVKIECKPADEFGNVLVKITTAPKKEVRNWSMGIYKGSSRLIAMNKVSIEYVVNPKSGSITSCWID